MVDNASDPRQIKAAKKTQQARDAEQAIVWTQLMGSAAGRSLIYDRLVRCHVFSASFSSDPYRTAFAEGERNIGLQDLNDIMRWCPDQYVQMMREASDREVANGRSTTSSAERSGDDSRSESSGPGGFDTITAVFGADGDWDPT